jgi:hypothetical protein
MPASKNVPRLFARYEKLKANLAEPGLLLLGTIVKRMDKRPDPATAGKLKTYGPYYQWTFKIEGKSRTVNLTPQQAAQYDKAIRNHRQMQRTIDQMRQLSLAILEATIEGVQKRKTKSAGK